MKILVAGIGNIFLGDDAFGVEVVRELAKRELPDFVKVVDFGIRGFDLAYALQDGYDVSILVDAVPMGQPPGTLYTIEPERTPPSELAFDTHTMNPVNVLNLLHMMDGEHKTILVVGCEPKEIGEFEGELDGLSEPVSAAIPEAIRIIEQLINDFAKYGTPHLAEIDGRHHA